MHGKYKFLIALIIFAVVLGTAAIILTKSIETNNEQIKEPTQTSEDSEDKKDLAPDFQMIDRNGNKVKLSDMRGKPVVLNFWASWCGPCKSEMPDFEEAYKEYGDSIIFMMVNLTDGNNETVETATAYVDGQGYTFPLYFDSENNGAAAYGVTSIPVTYFIDAEGYLVAYGRGAMDRETLQSGIDMLIK